MSSLHADLWSRYGTPSPLPVAEIVPILGPRVDLLKDAAAGAGSLKPVVAEGPRPSSLPLLPKSAECLCLAGPRLPWQDCIFTASVLQLAACAEDDRTQQRGRVLKRCSWLRDRPVLFSDCTGGVADLNVP